ncbi:hypothetical protein Q31b_34290 [Novipirellula aureliae]|uniref:Uncharacterized protein n=1 Tax=Novipirellula aureliae TaxID=2527966 RepID=A0A5C6DUT6_9BACT|nr:DUF488 family protein [Novipirellula aureliae]TWU40085.1 hypothetical protein Q31b_34290 [Novipirellula aureliae]
MSKKKRTIEIARAYDCPKSDNDYRALVDRLWPRGVKKQSLKLDQWAKELAPSNALREWFDHDPDKWAEFRKRFLRELSENKDEAYELLRTAGDQSILLIYAAKDEEHNNAVVLKEHLGRLKPPDA